MISLLHGKRFVPELLERNLVFAFNAESGSINSLVPGQAHSTATFARASSATYFDNDFIMRTVGNNIPRFHRGELILEPAATNLCTHSRQIAPGAGAWFTWVGGAVPVCTANETGVDGIVNSAYTIEDQSDVLFSGVGFPMVTAADALYIHASVFMKKQTTADSFPNFGLYTPAGDVQYWFHPVTGEAWPQGVTAVTYYAWVEDYGTWWKCNLTVKNTGGGGNSTLYLWPAVGSTFKVAAESATGSVVVDAVMMETGSQSIYPSSYMPTSGVAATRATEAGNPNYTLPSGIFTGDAHGTLVVDFSSTTDRDYHSVANGLVTCNADVLLLGLDATGDLYNSDGVNALTHNITLTRDRLHRAAVYFGGSVKNLGGGTPRGGVTWETEAGYDGAFAVGNLVFAQAIVNRLRIKRVWLFNKKLTTDQVNWL